MFNSSNKEKNAVDTLNARDEYETTNSKSRTENSSVEGKKNVQVRNIRISKQISYLPRLREYLRPVHRPGLVVEEAEIGLGRAAEDWERG